MVTSAPWKCAQRVLRLGLLLAAPAAVPAADDVAAAPEDSIPINWIKGPGTGRLGDLAEIPVPEGHLFTDGEGTRTLMEAMGNIVSDQEVGLLGSGDLEWFAVFEFDEIGFVKDDEKSDLDAEAILESIRKGTEAANKVRRERGFGAMSITGWVKPPHYNERTHNLEWAIRARDDEGGEVVNHNVRLLGRRGVMKVTLVCDVDKLQASLPLFEELLDGYSFNSGHQYGEYRKGDKIAKYGLTALVVGGASAVAVKSGLLRHLVKFIAVGIAAVGAFFKKLFGRKTE